MFSCLRIKLTGIAVVAIALLATSEYHSRSYTFGSVVNQSGYKSDGFAFLLWLLSIQWTATDVRPSLPRFSAYMLI